MERRKDGRRGSIHGGREAAIASHEGDGIDGEGGPRAREAYLSSFLGIAHQHQEEKRGKVRKCVCEETEKEGKRRLFKGALTDGPTTSPAVVVAIGLASRSKFRNIPRKEAQVAISLRRGQMKGPSKQTAKQRTHAQEK